METTKKYLKVTAMLVALFIGFRLVPIHYNFLITDIDRTSQLHVAYYRTLVFLLDNVVDSNDTVTLEINSYGGDVAITFDIINSLRKTPAHTVGHIKSVAYSAGAFLAITCDEVTAEVYSRIMFHKARRYIFGKPVIINNPLVDGYIHDIIKPHLSEREYQKLLSGGDVFIMGMDFARRVSTGKVPVEKAEKPKVKEPKIRVKYYGR